MKLNESRSIRTALGVRRLVPSTLAQMMPQLLLLGDSGGSSGGGSNGGNGGNGGDGGGGDDGDGGVDGGGGVDGVRRIDRTGQTMPTLPWLQSFWSFVAAFEERPQGVQPWVHLRHPASSFDAASLTWVDMTYLYGF